MILFIIILFCVLIYSIIFRKETYFNNGKKYFFSPIIIINFKIFLFLKFNNN